MTAIKGVGRRYANIVLKKADVDLTKRAGECTDEEVNTLSLLFSRFVNGHHFSYSFALLPCNRSRKSLQSSRIHANTKSQIGF